MVLAEAVDSVVALEEVLVAEASVAALAVAVLAVAVHREVGNYYANFNIHKLAFCGLLL